MIVLAVLLAASSMLYWFTDARQRWPVASIVGAWFVLACCASSAFSQGAPPALAYGSRELANMIAERGQRPSSKAAMERQLQKEHADALLAVRCYGQQSRVWGFKGPGIIYDSVALEKASQIRGKLIAVSPDCIWIELPIKYRNVDPRDANCNLVDPHDMPDALIAVASASPIATFNRDALAFNEQIYVWNQANTALKRSPQVHWPQEAKQRPRERRW